MTVQSSDARDQYVGTGVETNFPVTFQFFDETDLSVYELDASQVETLLVLNSDYTVNGGDGSTG